MKWVVLDLANFGKPMRLYSYDGNRPVPDGGVLFYALEGDPPTKFETREEADAAVARTVAHGAARGYGPSWEEGTYMVVTEAQQAEAIKELRSRDRRKGDKKKTETPP